MDCAAKAWAATGRAPQQRGRGAQRCHTTTRANAQKEMGLAHIPRNDANQRRDVAQPLNVDPLQRNARVPGTQRCQLLVVGGNATDQT
eukprot:8707593-Lingulodinium_polyedra.AAC.1